MSRESILGGLIVGLVVLIVSAACGPANTTTSMLTGKPNEYRYEDGVRCYASQSNSISCVVVK